MWWQRMPRWLFWGLATVASAVVLLFVLWWGPWLFTRHPSHGLTAEQALKARNDVRTTLVQAVAGLAVASGAVVTYRSFRHTRNEQDRAYRLDLSRQVTDTYTKAVEQLGDDQAPVRLGALYSLASLAQDNPPRRQTVIDVLCAYLRMPYTPPAMRGWQPLGAVGEEAEEAKPAGLAGKSELDAAQELQVRQTAQRLLAHHLCAPPGIDPEKAQSISASPLQNFWPGINIDLTGAVLVDLTLERLSVIHGTFLWAVFLGKAEFVGANFNGKAIFESAVFSGQAEFTGAKFESGWFARCTFSDKAGFRGAVFSLVATFDGATFSKYASFHGVEFPNHADFRNASFLMSVDFEGTSGDFWFDGAFVHRTDHAELNTDDLLRKWPAGWTIRRYDDDPANGTLVRVESETREG